MNKPDWKDAPEWAKLLAKDKDGNWFWYCSEPTKNAYAWVPKGKCEAAIKDWEKSLEARPSC